MRNKNDFAPTPPMGWNSYDYYDTTVNEEQVKANADYMAAHLKKHGWEYIVVDIEWYAIAAGTNTSTYPSPKWPWTNTPVCCRIPPAFLPLWTEPVSSLWPTISMTWG